MEVILSYDLQQNIQDRNSDDAAQYQTAWFHTL